MEKINKISKYWLSKAKFINQNLGTDVQPITPQELKEMHSQSIKRALNHRKLNPKLYEQPTR